jgi:hypothetical protein
MNSFFPSTKQRQVVDALFFKKADHPMGSASGEISGEKTGQTR